MLAKVQKLKDHLIVCGSGGTAIYTAEELSAVRRPVVLICEDDERLERVKAELPNVPVVVGDPTSDAVLHQAGVERAAGVVACTRNDKDNLIVTLTARQMNPTVRIVSRVSSMHEKEKVKNAGADSVVSPTHMGGLRMASELIRPNVVSFLDTMLRDRGVGRRIDEISFPPDSDFVGKVLADLGLGEVSRALLLACRDREGHWSYNPPPEYTVTPEMTLVVMGTPDEILALSKHLQGRMVSAPLPGKQPT